MSTRYLVTGVMRQWNGSKIPKFVYLHRGHVFTCEHEMGCCYHEDRSRAEAVLESVKRDRHYMYIASDWHIEEREVSPAGSDAWTPRQWYVYARRIHSVYMDAMYGNNGNGYEEENNLSARWHEIPFVWRMRAKATARQSAIDSIVSHRSLLPSCFPETKEQNQ